MMRSQKKPQVDKGNNDMCIQYVSPSTFCGLFLPEACTQLAIEIVLISHEGRIPSTLGSEAAVCSCPLYTPPTTATNRIV